MTRALTALAGGGLILAPAAASWAGVTGTAEATGPGPPPGSVHTEGPPPGHTGGFGEPSCVACHGQFDVNVGGSLTLEGLPAGYRPGAAYAVSVVLRSTEMVRAGFQAAVRFDGPDGAWGEGGGGQAGTLAPLDDRTTVVPDSSGAIFYVQHVARGTVVGDPEMASWSFQWIAPPEGRGAVSFHAAANSANGDDSPLGDLIYTVGVRVPLAEQRGPPGAP